MHTLISAIELPNITINVIILHQKVITFRENDEILFLEHPPRLILVPQAFFYDINGNSLFHAKHKISNIMKNVTYGANV